MRRFLKRSNAVERHSESSIVDESSSAIHTHLEVTGTDHRGRVHSSTTRHVVPLTQIAAGPIEEAASTLFPTWLDDDFVQQVLDLNLGEAESSKKVPSSTDRPLLDWIPRRDDFLQELLRSEAPSGELVCALCATHVAAGFYRCGECFMSQMYCASCIVMLHGSNPFHWVEAWCGSYFQRVSLKSLGLRIQLGHPIGEVCRNPTKDLKKDFVVLDFNGIQTVSLTFCQCERAADRPLQLLHANLFPATIKEPHTAATFRLLRSFQILSFLSKTSPYEYYSSLRRITDNTGEDVPDRYKQFLVMIREWRNLKMLKRAGRGHVENGIATTRPGECAVLCPACPHPGINIPSNYMDAENSWLYRLFQAKDANFRARRINISNFVNDPSLNRGSAYLVDHIPYEEFLEKLDKNETVKEDKSDCNNHDAIKSATSKGKKGVATTGIAAVDCSRHDMKRPAAVTTLSKGERYICTDYAFLSSLKQNAPRDVVESYDVVCQWAKNLPKRVIEYLAWFSPSLVDSRNFTFLVPKWHLAAHRDACRTSFSFNLTPGVGRTDGEAPERGWAAINGITASTKEMGPGSWRDTLDDFFADYNWRKVIVIHGSLLTKLVDAVPERADHVIAFLEFSEAIAEKRPDLIVTWTTDVQAWEADNTKTNPFVAVNRNTLSMNAIRLQLAEEDSADIEANKAVRIHKDISPGRLLSLGLEIEDQQHKLLVEQKTLGTHATPLQRSKLLERRNNLMLRITAWMKVQDLYVPPLAAYREEETDESPIAETVKLYLPSSICKDITVDPKLLDYEWRYRLSQASTTLDSLRGRLLMQGKMRKSKEAYCHSQRTNTRSYRLLTSLQDKIQYDVDKYRNARSCLANLAFTQGKPDADWVDTCQVLNDADVRGIDDADGEGVSEGRRTLSWIWKQAGITEAKVPKLGENLNVDETLRIEWCKARARAHRWQEECQLLVEEMRRTKEFFLCEAKRWGKLGGLTLGDDNKGLSAYAFRQAALRTRLYVRCTENWARVNEYLELGFGEPEPIAGELGLDGRSEKKRICIEYVPKVEERR